jgi:phage terminase small subunit
VKKPSDLSHRQAAFVDLFMISFNAAKAAVEAGYSKKTARSQGSRLLTNVDIKKEIARRREALSENLQNISRERFEREIATAAFANMSDFAPMFGEGTPAEKLALLTRDQAAAVAEITVEEHRDGRTKAWQVRRTRFKLVPKNPSLELLGKAKGWISGKAEGDTHNNLKILQVMLKDISGRQAGKPIVEIEPESLEPGLSFDDSRD